MLSIKKCNRNRLELKTKFFESEEATNQSVGQKVFLKEMDDKRAGREELVIGVGEGRIHTASRGIDLSEDWAKGTKRLWNKKEFSVASITQENFWS